MNKVDRIGQMLLALYACVQDTDFPDFQQAAVNLIKDDFDLDSGIWGMGSLVDGITPRPHHIHVHRKPPGFMENWDKVKHEDVLIHQAFQSPGRSIRTSLNDAVWNNSPGVREHCRRYDIGHVLCTFLFDPQTGLYHFISFYRSPEQPAFSEYEGRYMEIIAPHLAQAVTASRMRQLNLSIQPNPDERSLLAVMDKEGLVYQMEAGFVRLLNEEWPDWRGPRLPAEIAALDSKSRKYVGRHIVVSAEALKDMYLLRVRAISCIELLSRRELEIAQRYGRGDSYKEIAKSVGLSPATVRNHLAAVYAKLEIGDKAQLSRLLQRYNLNVENAS